jgi:hypothetical protein
MNKPTETAAVPSEAEVVRVVELFACVDDVTVTEIIIATELPPAIVERVLLDLIDARKVFMSIDKRQKLPTYSSKSNPAK